MTVRALPALRAFRAAAAAFVACAGAACASSPDLHTEAKPGASVADHRTYAWLDAARPDEGLTELMGTEFESLLEQSGDFELVSKGYRRDAEPALLVNWHLVARQRIDTAAMAELYGYGPGWRTWAAPTYPSATAPVSTDRDEEGTLVVDVLLASSRELLWRGFGTAEIDPSVPIPERRTRVATAVRKVMAGLPAAR